MEPTADFSKRLSHITVNLANLESNFREIRKRFPQQKIMAVVKANAYGHGITECAGCLENCGADYFGVALVEEGELLRKAGIKKPVHVFGGISGSQIERFLISDLELTASSLSKLKAIDEVSGRLGIRARVHLKIDTGMGRIGVRPESALALVRSCADLRHTEIAGIFSHFACADEQDLSFTQQQFQQFCGVLDIARKELGQQILAHMANSAALCHFPQSALDMIRPGLLLYGVSAAPFLRDIIPVRPVLSVHSQVVFFKVVRKGCSVSYGRSWQAEHDTRVVTIPIGYGDGYLRALSNKSSVLIKGRRYPVIGKICMDQLMVDIGDSEVFNEERVVLVGGDGHESISVEELAELAGSIPHEILALLNLRMPRKFIGTSDNPVSAAE